VGSTVEGMRARRRVVVTGLGLVSPVGHSVADGWANLVAGRSGIGPITRFDASAFACRFAGEVKGFQIEDYIPAKEARHMDTFIHYGLAASMQAVKDAGLPTNGELDEVSAERIGVMVGSGIGGLPMIEQTDGDYRERGPRRISPFFVPASIINMISGHVSIQYGFTGPNLAIVTACTTGLHCIGEAGRMIEYGDADVMIAGGAHTMIHMLGITGFNRLTALSTSTGDPSRASRPFDLTRDGFVMGEGSGMLILETLEHAQARGAQPIAEVVGYGSSADAYRITDIQPEGRGAAAAMEQALRMAGIDPHARRADGRAPIDYISAHGTGTKENDSIETLAVKRVFGDLAKSIPMSSVKSMLGHLIAAAGAVEFITCVLAIRHGMLPPTINYGTPDPELDLDYVPNTARPAKVDVCLSNSFGFGGQNDTVVVTRFAP
jgi:3-oxoacyl-[acyl-carrier-protein] synthase II